MILHSCTKNYDHMMFGCRVIAKTKQTSHFGDIFAHLKA